MDRMPTDIVTQGARVTGSAFIRIAGLQYLGQPDDLAVLVGDLDTHDVLPGITSHHTTLIHGQRHARSFRQVAKSC